MAFDTVRLRSPSLNECLAQKLHNFSVMKQGIELSSGQVLYELTSGELDGSYDSRIMFKVLWEDWENIDGRPELHPCDPYILVEASFPKVFHGQNIFGQIIHFQYACQSFIDVLGHLFGLDDDELPSAIFWEVRRVDWAEMFALQPGAIAEFFRGFSACKFPRRSTNAAKHGEHSMHFPGRTTTLRLYYKGLEFDAHDLARMRRSVLNYFMNRLEQPALRSQDSMRSAVDEFNQREGYLQESKANSLRLACDKKIKALQHLANRRLRCEVQVNAPKFLYDFAELIETRKTELQTSNRNLPDYALKQYVPRFPLVSDLTDEYFKKVYDTEMFKLLKEGKSDMETVRNHDTVRARLIDIYTQRSAKSLIAFWMILAGQGEDAAKELYSKSQFYDNRTKLIQAGVSWHSSNIYILPQGGLLPVDFQPVRSDLRRCSNSVRYDSIFNLHPRDYQLAKKAA